MALYALTLSDTVEYVSDLDPCKKSQQVPVDPEDPSKGSKTVTDIDEGATLFMLRPLDCFLNAHIYDNASSITGREGSEEVGIKTRVNQTNLDAVRFGLSGFKNFTDRKGTAVRFTTVNEFVNGREYTVASPDVMNCLGIRLIQELARKIKEISEVSEQQSKNSEGLSSQ